MKNRIKWLLAPIVALSFTLAESAVDDAAWKPLFDGKTLKGWHVVGAGKWAVENEVIIGKLNAEPRYGLLVSDKVFGDFTIRLKFKAAKGNSGFFFRTELKGTDESPESHGIQVEINPAGRGGTGGLWESYSDREALAAWPTREDVAKYIPSDDWNEMVVAAHGRKVSVTINGVKTAELKDDPGRLKGHFALQLHAGRETLVMFKDIEIRTE